MKSSLPSTMTIFASSLILAFGSIVFVRLVYAPVEEGRTATVTTLTSSANPAATAAGFTLTASVHLHGVAVRTGTVRFYDETNRWLLGVADVASPTITVSGLAPGARIIRADYSGVFRNGANIARPSSSPPLTQTILVSPDVLLSVVPDAGGDSRLITLKASVRAGSAPPSGSVTFRSGGQVLATRMLDHFGKAQFMTSALDGGSHLISADYHGDNAVAPGSASLHVMHGDRADRQALR